MASYFSSSNRFFMKILTHRLFVAFQFFSRYKIRHRLAFVASLCPIFVLKSESAKAF
nr:MAG TPA: hypothetical protein [Bacteriophage sp.]